jgi:hypothetical protein
LVSVLGAMSAAHCTWDEKGVVSLFVSPGGLRSLRSLVGLEPERLLLRRGVRLRSLFFEPLRSLFLESLLGGGDFVPVGLLWGGC